MLIQSDLRVKRHRIFFNVILGNFLCGPVSSLMTNFHNKMATMNLIYKVIV